VAATAEEAVVQAFLHARDCTEAPVSQRHLATAFGLSRPRVAELVSPLLAEADGHAIGGNMAGSVR
jgi:predicted XRE-type DNA-binding protein